MFCHQIPLPVSLCVWMTVSFMTKRTIGNCINYISFICSHTHSQKTHETRLFRMHQMLWLDRSIHEKSSYLWCVYFLPYYRRSTLFSSCLVYIQAFVWEKTGSKYEKCHSNSKTYITFIPPRCFTFNAMTLDNVMVLSESFRYHNRKKWQPKNLLLVKS